jgi:hypothetical protein
MRVVTNVDVPRVNHENGKELAIALFSLAAILMLRASSYRIVCALK